MKLADRPNPARGRVRRESLVDAGLELLAEAGWPAVTTRAVAKGSGCDASLIHYHFGGLRELHLAMARKAGDTVIAPVFDALMAAPTAAAALNAMRDVLPTTTRDEKIARLAVELMVGAMREPALGEALRDGLRDARSRLADRLEQLYVEWSPQRRAGVAVVIAALLDGLMLHAMLDAGLRIDDALCALSDLIGGAP